jgi:hypothetical protein
MVPAITHARDDTGKYRDPLEVAREKVAWILDNHHPEPIAEEKRAEMARILAAADGELRK